MHYDTTQHEHYKMRDESQAQRLFSTTPNHNSLPSFFFFATIPLLLPVLLTWLTLFSLSCLSPSHFHGILFIRFMGSLKSVWIITAEIIDQESDFQKCSTTVKLQLFQIRNLSLHWHHNKIARSFDNLAPDYKLQKTNHNLF